ncbi:MAG TPA: hypothetical protein VHD91_04530 [Gaiellaceae bacterium]|nr:hypothetical protein [Gaiellaceae bacterium]
MKPALAAGLVAVVALPLAAWLARPGGGGGGSTAVLLPATTTSSPQLSRQPPAPPRDALVLAGEAGPYAVALAVEPRRLEAIVLSPEGGGAKGIEVSVNGDVTTDCGSGCWAASGPHGRVVSVLVAHEIVMFEIPAHPTPAAALVRRERALYRALAGVTYRERLASGQGGLTVSTWRLERPDRFTYAIPHGAQAVVIGTHRWDRSSPRDRWVESPQLPRLPQPAAQWRHATNAWLLEPGVVAFADPSIPAYFQLEFDPHTLRPRLLRMTAAAHFMTDRYVSFAPARSIRAPRRAAGG